jgi:hypothetical protein
VADVCFGAVQVRVSLLPTAPVAVRRRTRARGYSEQEEDAMLWIILIILLLVLLLGGGGYYGRGRWY